MNTDSCKPQASALLSLQLQSEANIELTQVCHKVTKWIEAVPVRGSRLFVIAGSQGRVSVRGCQAVHVANILAGREFMIIQRDLRFGFVVRRRGSSSGLQSRASTTCLVTIIVSVVMRLLCSWWTRSTWAATQLCTIEALMRKRPAVWSFSSIRRLTTRLTSVTNRAA
jgi:hypothetical protein